jgi:hypothetical protein
LLLPLPPESLLGRLMPGEDGALIIINLMFHSGMHTKTIPIGWMRLEIGHSGLPGVRIGSEEDHRLHRLGLKILRFFWFESGSCDLFSV